MGEGRVLGDSGPRLHAGGHVLAEPAYPAALVGLWSPRGGSPGEAGAKGNLSPPASLSFPVSPAAVWITERGSARFLPCSPLPLPCPPRTGTHGVRRQAHTHTHPTLASWTPGVPWPAPYPGGLTPREVPATRPQAGSVL